MKNSSSSYAIKKHFQSNERYVAPVPKMIGGRWDKYYDRKLETYLEKFKVCEFYYIPINKTIITLFKNFVSRLTKGIIYVRQECIRNFAVEMYTKTMNFSEVIQIQLEFYYDDLTIILTPKTITKLNLEPCISKLKTFQDF